LSLLQNKWLIVSLALTCWALLASFAAGYYYYRYIDLQNRIGGEIVYVDIGIDYGNLTRVWHNNTKALTGTTLFDVTKHVANVTYTVGLYGTEILSINNVQKNDTFGWTYWRWNSTASAWEIVWLGVDQYIIVGGETFMWYYQSGFNPPP